MQQKGLSQLCDGSAFFLSFQAYPRYLGLKRGKRLASMKMGWFPMPSAVAGDISISVTYVSDRNANKNGEVQQKAEPPAPQFRADSHMTHVGDYHPPKQHPITLFLRIALDTSQRPQHEIFNLAPTALEGARVPGVVTYILTVVGAWPGQWPAPPTHSCLAQTTPGRARPPDRP